MVKSASLSSVNSSLKGDLDEPLRKRQKLDNEEEEDEQRTGEAGQPESVDGYPYIDPDADGQADGETADAEAETAEAEGADADDEDALDSLSDLSTSGASSVDERSKSTPGGYQEEEDEELSSRSRMRPKTGGKGPRKTVAPASLRAVLGPQPSEDESAGPDLDDPSDAPEPRPSTGQKGGKGMGLEAAVETAVAKREEVERRREELKRAEESVALPKRRASITAAAGGAAVMDGDDIIVEARRPERLGVTEERHNVIQFHAVENDRQEKSLIILAGLKNIFQKQLPKMPREYITRLVFDRNHKSMAIVKRGLQVVGGITYRPFEARGFAEIVFCAIAGTEQVKGYGSHMMNHLKDHVKDHSNCTHFLTYADNYAIGYFKKQGFTKEITLERSRWAGYIKDYEGATLLQCSMLPHIRYLEAHSILERQKEAILARIRKESRSHVVYPGLQAFQQDPRPDKVDVKDIPGLCESGWTREMDELTRRPPPNPQHAVMQRLLGDLQNHPASWAFQRPVNKEEVTDYYDVIKNPMDLETMEYKLETYNDLKDFLADAQLIFNNCRAYNSESSSYVKNANRLEKDLNEWVKGYAI